MESHLTLPHEVRRGTCIGAVESDGAKSQSESKYNKVNGAESFFEANSFSSVQEIIHILSKPKI
jgi:hypothetical protein